MSLSTEEFLYENTNYAAHEYAFNQRLEIFFNLIVVVSSCFTDIELLIDITLYIGIQFNSRVRFGFFRRRGFREFD